MEEARIRQVESGSATWLDDHAPFLKVEVKQGFNPQLAHLTGVCLAATASWVVEMKKNDRRLDKEVVTVLVSTANRYRSGLDIPEHGEERASSMFGPNIRHLQAAYRVAYQLGKKNAENEVYKRAGLEVERGTHPDCVESAVMEFVRTMNKEGRAIFLLTFRIDQSFHVIGLHGNREEGTFGFFDANLGVYRYRMQLTLVAALEDLLSEYYSSVTGDLELERIKL